MFWVTGFDLLYSLQDIDIDKKLGLHSIPAKFGKEKTLKIAQVFHTWAILFWFIFVIIAGLGYFAYTAVFTSAIFLIYEHVLVNRDFKKINKAFFTINGYLGIMFIIFIILDQLFK